MSSLPTLSVPTCTERLCINSGLYRSGSAVTVNSEEGQSLAVASLGPALLHGWLPKLIISVLFGCYGFNFFVAELFTLVSILDFLCGPRC